MTEAEFFFITGNWPIQDDLERANCPLAGQIGHLACGVCDHGRPVFLCPPCFVTSCNQPSEGRKSKAVNRKEKHSGSK